MVSKVKLALALLLATSILFGLAGLVVGSVVNLLTRGSGEALSVGVLCGLFLACVVSALLVKPLSASGDEYPELDAPNSSWQLDRARTVLKANMRWSVVRTAFAVLTAAAGAYLFVNEATRETSGIAGAVCLFFSQGLVRGSWGVYGRYASAFFLPAAIVLIVVCFESAISTGWSAVALVVAGVVLLNDLKAAKTKVEDARRLLDENQTLAPQ